MRRHLLLCLFVVFATPVLAGNRCTQHPEYMTSVPATNATLVVSNRMGVTRCGGIIINHGPSGGWLSRANNMTSNAIPLHAGGSYSLYPPVVSAGEYWGVDNDAFYFWSTNTCTIYTGEDLAP